MDYSAVNISICDDDANYVSQLENVINKILFQDDTEYQLSTFTSPADLLNCTQRCDILFLDIEMPEMGGFTAARGMLEKHPGIKIIFLTSHEEFIQEAFKVKAYRYLYKPISEPAIEEALEDAIRELCDVDGIIIKQRSSQYFIRFSDIYYIESLGEQSALYMRDVHYLTSKTLKQWLLDIGKPGFYLCHKSYIVNFAHAIQIEKGKITLDNKNNVPISIRNFAVIKKAFHEYIQDHSRFL